MKREPRRRTEGTPTGPYNTLTGNRRFFWRTGERDGQDTEEAGQAPRTIGPPVYEGAGQVFAPAEGKPAGRRKPAPAGRRRGRRARRP